MRPRPTFLYLPGLISLIFLPILSIVLLWGEGSFKQYRMIKVHYSKRDKKDINKFFDFREPVRHYINYRITGQNTDTTVYLNIKQNLQIESICRDTATGVHIRFEGRATYFSLIHILNIFKQEKWKNYCISDHEIWAWYEEPIMLGPYIDIGNCLLCGCIQDPRKDSLYAEVQRAEKVKIENNYKSILWAFWPVWLLFLVMIFVVKYKSN